MPRQEIVTEYELELLRTQLEQEQRMVELLNTSITEIKASLQELEKRFDGIEDEGNEWKTRYETQQEINQQLEKRLIILQEKHDRAKASLRQGNGAQLLGNRSVFLVADLGETGPQALENLSHEKLSLKDQLRNIEWKLEQESKAYQRANEERKQYIIEINALRTAIEQSERLNAPPEPRR